jgi:hypothetical protein
LILLAFFEKAAAHPCGRCAVPATLWTIAADRPGGAFPDLQSDTIFMLSLQNFGRVART